MKTFPIDNLRILKFTALDSIIDEVDFYACEGLFGNFGAEWSTLPSNLKKFQEAYDYLSHQHVFAFNAVRNRMSNDR